MTRTLLSLNDLPYGTERSHNALRLADSLARRPGEEVKVFLMGNAASCAKARQHVPQGYYHVETMLQGPATRNGVEVGACGSCVDARGITAAELAAGEKRSSLSQLTDWTAWADKTLAF